MNIRKEDLTFENLEYKYGTGRSYTISGTGRDRVLGYRCGVQTKLGDIELSEWMDLMRMVIEQAGEQKLHADLVQWESEHNYCRRKKADLEQYALELHSSRIFDNPAWVDFIPFNARYRPEAILGVDTLDVFMSCCKKWGTVTKIQTENYKQNEKYVSCPFCGRFAKYHFNEVLDEKELEVNKDLMEVLPTTEEIGIASAAAVKRVSKILLAYDLKYRILDFCYPGIDGNVYNRDAANLVRYLPHMQKEQNLRVYLSYKCKKMGKRLKAFVKENGAELKTAGAQFTHDGIMFFFSASELLCER